MWFGRGTSGLACLLPTVLDTDEVQVVRMLETPTELPAMQLTSATNPAANPAANTRHAP